MDILKTAQDWAKAEMFSTSFFILFGLLFVAASIGFWQLGKTDVTKAYVIPMFVAGILVLVIGFGLFFTNKNRVTKFEKDYHKDAPAFVQSEIERVDATLTEYKNVFRVIPILIIAAALIIIFLNTQLWRAIGITAITMLVILMLVDGTAWDRIKEYKKQLHLVENQQKKLTSLIYPE